MADNVESGIIEIVLKKGKAVASRNFNLCKSYVEDILSKRIKSVQKHPSSHQNDTSGHQNDITSIQDSEEKDLEMGHGENDIPS
ncbi:hypothetical protein Tco_1579274 [Tanacetum coccineum]